MLYYIYDISTVKEVTKELSRMSQLSFKILQSCNNHLMIVLFASNDLIKYFFSLVSNNDPVYMTARGYFQELFKAFLSE